MMPRAKPAGLGDGVGDRLLHTPRGTGEAESGLVVRLVALYLPQFHAIPENDEWWGKGFTEWTNARKARPLFRGHDQPRVPTELGYYDLRVPEVRAAQADLAREHGIEAFCYYHYWFAGKRLLERPFLEVLESGEPNFPFCLCWANESWSGVWHGCPDRILVRQDYPGTEDDERHFRFLLRAFRDGRYLTVEGKPVFLVYRPDEIPEPRRMTDQWRRLAEASGLPGLHLVGMANVPWDPIPSGFDAVARSNLTRATYFDRRLRTRVFRRMRRALGRPQHVYSYRYALPLLFVDEAERENVYACIAHDWDNSPRTGREALIMRGAAPELFGRLLAREIERARRKPYERRFVFLKSWNEWAEGNYLEPDRRHGRGYLEVIREATGADRREPGGS